MSRFPVFRRTLRDLRWLILWFGAGLGLYAAAMVWLFPQFEDAIGEMAEGYPEGLLEFFGGGNIAEPAGFLTLEYQSFAVLIFIIFAVVASTGQLAGSEGRGALELVLAQPIARSRLMLEVAAACVAAALGIVALIGVGWLASVPFVDLGDLGWLNVMWATVGALPVVLCFGALGFLFGAVAPSRGSAAGVLTVLVILSYLAASLAQAIEPIEWMRHVSPYHYSDASRWLTDGPVWWHQVGLLAAAALLFALAVRAFQGREIGAGRWQASALLGRRT